MRGALPETAQRDENRHSCSSVRAWHSVRCETSGRLGIWRRHQPGPGIVPELEALGYDALWLGSSPSLEQARPYLEASEQITIATGILNIWQHEPADVAAQHAELTPRFPRQLPARHRRRAPRGDERLHAAAVRDARVLRRPRRRRSPRAARRADRRRARAEDARPRGRALARHPPLLHDARAHALRARAGRARRGRRPGARRRGRDRPRARPRGRARLRRDVPAAQQLHLEPAAVRLHRGRHRRRRQRPPDRRGDPARLGGGDRRGRPGPLRRGRRPRLPAAARPRPGAGRGLPGAGRRRCSSRSSRRAAAAARGRRARSPCGATRRRGTCTRSGPCGGGAGSPRRRTRSAPWSRRSLPP